MYNTNPFLLTRGAFFPLDSSRNKDLSVDEDRPIKLKAVLICTSHFTGRKCEVIKFKGRTTDYERKGKRVSQQAFPKRKLPYNLCQNTSLTLSLDGFLKASSNVCSIFLHMVLLHNKVSAFHCLYNTLLCIGGHGQEVERRAHGCD